MPKFSKQSEKPPGGGTIQSVAYSTGKSEKPLGNSGQIPFASSKVSEARSKAAKSMVRKG